MTRFRWTLVGSKPLEVGALLVLWFVFQMDPCGVEARSDRDELNFLAGFRWTLVGSKPETPR